MCDDTQYLHDLSPTESGRVHDKKVADEYPLHLPAGSVLRQDLGFLGHRPPGVLVEMPHKKPPEGRADVFPATLQPAAESLTRGD